MFRKAVALLLIFSSFSLLAISLQGSKTLPSSTTALKPSSLVSSAMGVSESFRNYAKANALNPALPEEKEEFEIPNQFYIPRGGSGTNQPTAAPSVVSSTSTMFNQTTNGTLPAIVSADYAGLGTGFNGNWTVQGLLPPDTTMAVGNNQILQWVNIRLTILNKSTGSPLLGGAGFVNANQIWSGLGGGSVCATQNQGDPIVQYDRLTNRWFLSQFAFHIAAATNGTGYPAAPYALCVAVSQTNDATGVYNLYEFSVPTLPDYPKLGLWPDGLYMTANDFSFSTATGASTYVGTSYFAFDKAAMIAGGAAAAITFSGLDPRHFASLPGDFEGSLAPPANTTAYFLSGDWFTKNSPPYFLQLRRFHPDFVTPGNSTLTDGFGGASDSFVSLPFDNSVVGACGDGGGQCVPQPGTTRKLDTLSQRPMYRLAYRNLGSGRESLVFTQSIDPVGLAVAGIQLVEIRNPGANPPVVFNNVNFNPDATNRWMGAAATDKLGNIGLGYSVASATVSPGIRIAGRLRNDIRSTLRGELNVTTGSGSQTASAQRWGDYSTMQIDPDDDCTFWYTQEYIINTAGADWATRIVGFKFNSCH
jgi:hypothetical protein